MTPWTKPLTILTSRSAFRSWAKDHARVVIRDVIVNVPACIDRIWERAWQRPAILRVRTTNHKGYKLVEQMMTNANGEGFPTDEEITAVTLIMENLRALFRAAPLHER